jgi:glycosyltransferase involved in cell wall biosynthesis
MNAMLLELQTRNLGMDALPEIAATVSVIIRTKNRPHFLREAIVSVASQTYRDIELVVVNDGGENVEKLVREYATGGIRHVVYEALQPGRGRAAAANAGLGLATGKYLIFLDDDDLLEATHVQQLVDFTLKNDAKVVYSGTKVIQVNDNGMNHDIYEYSVPYSSERLLVENFIPIHSALFNRELIDNGICFDTNFDLFEDWDFWLQLSHKTEFLYSPMVTAIYRLHNNASDVHKHTEIISHYLRIYRKWLSSFSMENIFSLLQKTHQWTDDKIAILQDINAKKLDDIGGQYSYAQQIVRERDAQLQELKDLYTHAVKVIDEKNHELDKIRSSALWPTYKILLK